MANCFILHALCFLLSAIFLCLAPLQIQAHTHSHHQGAHDPPELISTLYEKAVLLSPEILKSPSPSLAEPYIQIGGETIVLNTQFWELVKGWLRLYRQEIEVYCPCDINAEELVKSAKNYIPAGFTYSKIGKPSIRFAEKIIVESYGLSAKYGKIALLLKASAEIAETILSMTFGGKGVHFICTVIDTMILFLFRKTQIYSRVFQNSRTMNQSGLLMMFRLLWLNRLTKKAESKVFFYLNSSEVNQTNLIEVNQEGVGKNKRAKWVSAIAQKAKPVLEEIQVIDKKLETKGLSKRQQNKLLNRRRKLYKKIEHFTTVSKKSYFGKRYKRFLLLRSRKGKSDYLKGTSLPDIVTSKNWFWALAIQENILERALARQASIEMENPYKENQTLSLKKDEIRSGLAQEFIEKINQPGLEMTNPSYIKKTESKNPNEKNDVHIVEKILMDIENIFNPYLTVKERYLLVSILESGLTGFFEYYLNFIYNKLSQSTEDMSTRSKAQLKWRLARFTYYVFSYTDFLRTIAFVKNKTTLMLYQYEAMESFLLFFEYLHKLSRIKDSPQSNASLLSLLDKNLDHIQSFQIQKEKRTAFSWIPFHTPRPYCRNLVRSF